MVTSVFVSSKGGIVEAEVSSILIYQFFVDKYYTHNKKISAISINRKNDFWCLKSIGWYHILTIHPGFSFQIINICNLNLTIER